MAAVEIELADAIVAAINAATLSQVVAATRVYKPVYELADDEPLRVDVIPSRLASEALSRAATKEEHTVSVGILAKLPAKFTNVEIDPWMLLASEIGELFERENFTLATAGKLAWLRNERIVPFLPESLHEKDLFFTVINITYYRARQ